MNVREPVSLGWLRIQLDRLAGTGRPLPVHIHASAFPADERVMAHRAVELYMLCFAQPAVTGIVWHGFWDGEPGVRGGLLRRDFSPRPAFRYLHKLLHTVWHSRAQGRTDAAGRFHFRGYFGRYLLTFRSGDQAATVQQADFAQPAPSRKGRRLPVSP